MLDFGFYNMDCMVGMREFPDKFFDLAIVDPPYGIGIASHKCGQIVGGVDAHSAVTGGYGRGRPMIKGGKAGARPGQVLKVEPKPYHAFDDDRPPDEGYFAELERVSKRRIIWGGNFMLDHLSAATCMIVWDKKRRGLDQADCEIAWTNIPGQSRIFEYRWNGMLQEKARDKEKRIHPTQKPVALYTWLLARYAKPGDVILDTHVGSASSLIACRRAGLKYVGFEIDPVYYDMARERLEQELNQVNITDLL